MNTRLYFSNKYIKPAVLDIGTEIYFIPSENNWNDFGYSLMVELVIATREVEIRLSSGVKAFINGETNTSYYLQKTQGPIEISKSEYSINLSVFLARKENYLKILSVFPFGVAKDILLSINDISARRLFTPNDEKFLVSLQSDAVQNSFLRTSEAYLTFIGLDKLILKANRQPTETDPISELEFLESISNSGSVISLPFTSDRLGRNLIHAIIGRNGLGKTRLLMDLANTLSGLAPDSVSAEEAEWVNELLERNSYRVVVLTHEPDRWERSRAASVEVFPLNIVGPAWISLGRVLYDLARSSSADTSDFSWNALRRITREHLPIDQLHFPRNDGTYLHWKTIQNTFNGQEVMDARAFDETRPITFIDDDGRILDISSGQKNILTFLTRLFQGAHGQTVYLFDEPEVHLHPQFISLVMLSLYDALNATGSVAVLATHSPYVIRELDKSCVTVLKPNKDEGIEFARPTLQTRGGNISAISEFVFEHDASTSLTQSRLLEFVMDRGTGFDQNLLDDLAGLIGSEAINRIPEILAEGKDAKLPR